MKGKSALVLVAHADDETLGAGGFIPRLIERDYHVAVVVVSKGVYTSQGIEHDNRQSVHEACQVLGVHALHFLDYEDQKFDKLARADIADSVSRLGVDPDLVISHVDTDLNQDHRIVLDVAKVIGRPRHKPVTILGCEVPGISAWNASPFQANYYVNIGRTLDLKLRAFSQYANEQQEFPHPCSIKGLTVLAELRGMESGFLYAEAYHVIRMFDP
jgi:LmbE family N-acetylglucosaminyl deacetylase